MGFKLNTWFMVNDYVNASSEINQQSITAAYYDLNYEAIKSAYISLIFAIIFR